MWCFRRTLKIKWSDKVRNEDVLTRIKEKRRIMKHIAMRRSKWIGHILRHDGLLHTLIEGMYEGNVPRGRPRKDFISQLKNDMGCSSYAELKRMAEDRDMWRRKTQIIDSDANQSLD
uniref:Endonuclease-reverse transcriptase n=2 Tax=Cacopsylla melanoneura TaxID=428564 RepID=A0A8D9ART7_9HEMI